MVAFYRATREPADTLYVWYKGCSAAHKKALQRVLKYWGEKKSPTSCCPFWRTSSPPTSADRITLLLVEAVGGYLT